MKKVIGSLILFVFLISLASCLSASNESIQASELVAQARQDIIEMQARNISVVRVNESYQDAFQLYSAQKALENTGKRAKYDLVIEYAVHVNDIKKSAFKADDELRIFLEAYDSSAEKINLSEMDEDYNAIIVSFKEERFEDTLELIDIGYERLSEVQSSQTAVRLFYSTTSRTLKNFFINNWLKLVIGIVVVITFLIIFKKALSKFLLVRKEKYLSLQKNVLNSLIKELQKNYFKTKKTSEVEYRVKLKKFKEMILDINRQIPLLKEEMVKLTKAKFKKVVGKK